MKKVLQHTIETTEVVKYNVDAAIIAELDAKYADITIIEDEVTLEMVKGGQKAYRDHRLDLDAWHKTGKAPWAKKAKAYDTAKNAFKTLLTPGEAHLKKVRDAYEDGLKAVERERVKKIQNMIGDIKGKTMGLAKMTSAQLGNLYDRLKNTSILEEDYQEFLGEASATVHNTLIDINVAFKNAEYNEEQEQKRKAEAEQLETQKLEWEAAQKKTEEDNAWILAEQAEQQKGIDERNKRIEEQEQILIDEQNKLKAELQAKAQKEREEEIAKQAAERAKQEAEAKAEQDRLDGLAQEKVDKEEAERQELLEPDKSSLISWVHCFNSDVIHSPKLNSDDGRSLFTELFEDMEMFKRTAMLKISQL